ncbi:2276_t:CDS:2 [Acaulospora colombiana]|uniref:2276_t:CDS:1 n=1 Tax=Acaulospora colombiana TaxID=27376 RepID=A0ACA9N1A5_9GLOM|nr:2276_t:CDS:2 [Acaulospora colombiana]
MIEKIIFGKVVKVKSKIGEILEQKDTTTKDVTIMTRDLEKILEKGDMIPEDISMTLAEQLNEELQEENHKVRESYNQLNKEFNDIIPCQQQEIERLQTREQILEMKSSSFETERNLLSNRNKILRDQVFEMKETFKTSTLKYEEKIKGLNEILDELITTFEARTLEYETKVNELNEELKELKKYKQISQKIMKIFKRRKTQEK